MSNFKEKFCPQCGKSLEISNSSIGWLLPEQYECLNCNYQGSVFFDKINKRRIDIIIKSLGQQHNII